jgi:outer membrane murein-binding lipoprotein Lpp
MTRSLRLIELNVLGALLGALLFSGCSASHSRLSVGETQIAANVASLQSKLQALGRETDREEARRVAETAVAYSFRLADEYRVVPPARWHNLLIQMGFRDRGLCFHWTEDLMKRLAALNLKTFQLHWGVAHKGSELREHNSVVITARNQPFDNGLVLDPWRNSGDLYWAAVSQDGYPWVPLPPDQW